MITQDSGQRWFQGRGWRDRTGVLEKAELGVEIIECWRSYFIKNKQASKQWILHNLMMRVSHEAKIIISFCALEVILKK